MPAWTRGIAIAVVSYVLHHRTTEKVKQYGDQFIFVPRLAARILVYGVTPLYIVASISALFEIPGDRQWGVFLLFVGLAALNLYIWPGIIIVDSSGVRRVWFGLYLTKMAWIEIKTASFLEFDNYVVLRTADGRTLKTSFLHVDPYALVDVIRKHIRVDISKVRNF
jgi:hypothetical protein